MIAEFNALLDTMRRSWASLNEADPGAPCLRFGDDYYHLNLKVRAALCALALALAASHSRSVLRALAALCIPSAERGSLSSLWSKLGAVLAYLPPTTQEAPTAARIHQDSAFRTRGSAWREPIAKQRYFTVWRGVRCEACACNTL